MKALIWMTWQQEVLGDRNRDTYGGKEGQGAVGYVGLQLREEEAGKNDFRVSAQRR